MHPIVAVINCDFSPLSAYILEELCLEINFPPDVFNITCGDVREVGIPLFESKPPKLITIIGYRETPQELVPERSQTTNENYSMSVGRQCIFYCF